MSNPIFLSINEVLWLHSHQIQTYGGRSGMRDQGLLESALAQPPAEFEGKFLHPDLYEMAAAYLYHLTQNHPFHDGNKRIGAACAHAFLYINRIELTSECESTFESLVLEVAQLKTL